MTHTPGPWRIDTSSDGRRAIEARVFDGSWKYIVDRVRGGSPEQADANANLIAAAPELLAALKRQVCHACLRLLGNPPLGHNPCQVCAADCAAIAKAGGAV